MSLFFQSYYDDANIKLMMMPTSSFLFICDSPMEQRSSPAGKCRNSQGVENKHILQ
jgi:hypothetical protein